MKCPMLMWGEKSPMENPSSKECQKSAKYGNAGVFSMTMAATAAANMIMVALVEE